MRSYAVPFADIDQDKAFKRLARETRGQLVDGNTTIRWLDGIARGQVKKWHLDAGLHMRVWNLVFSEPVALRKQAVPLYINNSGYSLLCILSPESVTLKSVNHHQQINKVRERNMVLAPETVNADLQIGATLPVQLIDFQIAPYWFRKQPGYVHVSKYFDERVVEHDGLPVLIEPCVKKNKLIAGKLFSHAASNNTNVSELLSLSGFLITDFLDRLTNTGSSTTCSHINMYYDKVVEAEGILLTYLHTSLPRLENVAQQVALSESTLKRYFKLIFGKSIYEYYLTRKMEMARQLLLEKPLTVNEAAELMGYEKVSNFIDIFKKHHGYSPGTIRKKIVSVQDTISPEHIWCKR
jgi:AraC-like DNA-binding protein